MTNKSLSLTESLYDYLLAHSLRETEVLRRLRRETAGLEMARMQIAPEQGQFMGWLVRALGARRCLEIGTFTGYSALVCAQALPDDGYLLTLDCSAEWTAIARRFWAEAGLSERIELRLGDAADSLARLIEDGVVPFDFVFIDADKEAYSRYIELSCSLLRRGGVIVLDNTLWGGRVADSTENDSDTCALRSLNQSLHLDRRFDLSMLPVGDGLTLLLKR